MEELGAVTEGSHPDPYAHLKPHCQRAGDGRGFECLLCGKRGRDMYNMREHIEAVHTHLSPGYECSLCTQQFKSHNAWKTHMKRHHYSQ